MSWITDKAAVLSRAELLDWNEAINKALAKRLEDDQLDVSTILPITDALPDYLLSLGNGDREFEGLRTGIAEIDHLIGGLNKFTLMAARAGVGKSTLAMQMAIGTAMTEGIPTLYYSFEMPRRDVFTMMVQNLATTFRLTRKEIILHGNNPTSSDAAASIQDATAALQELGGLFYVIDATDGEPTLDRMSADITAVTTANDNIPPLVILDSIQDLVTPDGNGATMAEAQCAQRIVEIQQATDATFLAISQKAKGSNPADPYAGVLGSVSLIHKPSCVIELLGVHDLIRGVKDTAANLKYLKLADLSDMPRPVVCRVLKGRFNGSGYAPLKHYGRYGYFEVGRIPDYDTENSLYDLNGFAN